MIPTPKALELNVNKLEQTLTEAEKEKWAQERQQVMDRKL